jgi:demethylmenaquinone methyltransferase/2-methoxy-6-polyprenyl-1,4-benzoquinol methylase
MALDPVIAMQRYYALRAPDYEAVYDKPERQVDLRVMEAWLGGAFSGRRVLELACGTGWWTAHGARTACSWLATDINPETLAIARTKAVAACVEWARCDAYALDGLGGRRFDGAFAGFWWSHVPRQRLGGWLQSLHACLEPGARVVMMDNRHVAGSSTAAARCDEQGNSYQQRSLPDGTVHEVLKNFPTEAEAIAALGPRACRAEWIRLDHYWILSYFLN